MPCARAILLQSRFIIAGTIARFSLFPFSVASLKVYMISFMPGSGAIWQPPLLTSI